MSSFDVMRYEANLWVDAPPRRKRKLEAEPPLPPPPEDYSVPESDSDDENDKVEREKYEQHLLRTGGFDIEGLNLLYGDIGYCSRDHSTTLLGKLGLHCYNLDNKKDLQFKDVIKVNAEAINFMYYYITLEAIDPLDGLPVTFQTSVWQSSLHNDERLRWVTCRCRIKPQVPGYGQDEVYLWDENAIDEFYTGDMSRWLDNDALTASDKLQYYEAKESDLRDNKWLYLYAEIALFSEWEVDLSRYLPLEIDRVVVRTKEDVESSLKLKSSNAVFYIDFKARGGPTCRGIIRQTRDGIPHHMCLQAKCWIDK